MQHCPFCQVDVAGDKDCCPLCGGPLQGEGRPEEELFPPEARQSGWSRRGVLRVLALAAAAVTALCVMINAATGTEVWWALFVAAGLLCALLTCSVALHHRRDLLQNLGWQAALVSVLSVLWDLGTGWRGWSLDYVLPCVGGGGLAMALLLTRLLRLPVRSAVSVLGGLGLLGLVPGVLAALGLVGAPLPSLLCAGLAVAVLAGLLLFRWRIAKGELSRRFHL